MIRNRQALSSEIDLFEAQLDGPEAAAKIEAAERERFQAGIEQESARLRSAEAQVKQLRDQIAQVEIQMGQNEIQLASAEETLKLNQGILEKISLVHAEGAIAELQFLRQKDEVQSGQAEVNRLRREDDRLKKQITQLNNQIAQVQEDRDSQGASTQVVLHDRVPIASGRLGRLIARLVPLTVN